MSALLYSVSYGSTVGDGVGVGGSVVSLLGASPPGVGPSVVCAAVGAGVMNASLGALVVSAVFPPQVPTLWKPSPVP